MNAEPEMDDCFLAFRKQVKGRDRLNSRPFLERFLYRPCQACGSTHHALLRRASEVIDSNLVRYEYECRVVNDKPLYPEGNIDAVTVKYYMSASRLAEACQYDLENAQARVIIKGASQSKMGCLDSFLNMVRVKCLQHSHQGMTGTTTMDTARTKWEDIDDHRDRSRKRSRKEISPENHQLMETPPRRSERHRQLNMSKPHHKG